MSWCASALRKDLRDLGLSNTGRPFDQQRLAERHGQVQGRRYGGVSNVNLLFQHLLDLSHFFSQFVFSLFTVAASRSKSSAVLMLSGKGRSK